MFHKDMGKAATCVSRLFRITCLGSDSLSTLDYGWRLSPTLQPIPESSKLVSFLICEEVNV